MGFLLRREKKTSTRLQKHAAFVPHRNSVTSLTLWNLRKRERRRSENHRCVSKCVLHRRRERIYRKIISGVVQPDTKRRYCYDTVLFLLYHNICTFLFIESETRHTFDPFRMTFNVEETSHFLVPRATSRSHLCYSSDKHSFPHQLSFIPSL